MKTVRELAEYLSISYERARQMVSQGEIQASNIANGKRPCYRISDEAIREYLTKTSNVKPSPQKRSRRATQREWV